jgi:CO/xanthine dehydrogenase FAD-binding subunit
VIVEDSKCQYCFPAGVAEAYRLKQQYGEQARFIAGGTDLLLRMERENIHPHLLIDLTRIPALHRLEVSNGRVLIGSAVTYSRLLSFEPLLSGASFLAKAIRTIGGVQIRNIATLAGNLINASPAGDTLPPLYCLEAKIDIDGPMGQRCLPIHEFVRGVRKTALAPSELVTQVNFDLPGPGWYGTFEKLGLRRAMAIAVASVSLMLKVEDRKITQARIALGAVAPTVIRVPEAESCLSMQSLDDQTIDKAAHLSAATCIPIDDVRATSRYRREAVRGLVRRGLRVLRNQINPQE